MTYVLCHQCTKPNYDTKYEWQNEWCDVQSNVLWWVKEEKKKRIQAVDNNLMKWLTVGVKNKSADKYIAIHLNISWVKYLCTYLYIYMQSQSAKMFIPVYIKKINVQCPIPVTHEINWAKRSLWKYHTNQMIYTVYDTLTHALNAQSISNMHTVQWINAVHTHTVQLIIAFNIQSPFNEWSPHAFHRKNTYIYIFTHYMAIFKHKILCTRVLYIYSFKLFAKLCTHTQQL